LPLLDQLIEKYPKEVKLVFKNFPLRNHNFARRAATAAMAANEQGKFWQFHDKLFEDFRQLNEEKLREIAAEVGIDMKRFENDMKSRSIFNQIETDLKDASAVEVRGTPTIFVNGKLLKNRSMAGFQTVIEKELNKAGSK